MIMKNSNLCSSNPSCRIGDIKSHFKVVGERATFHGDDIDYQAFDHKYDEAFTDRGATDE